MSQGIEVVNFEIKMLNKALSAKIDLLPDIISIDHFQRAMKKISSILIRKLTQEMNRSGFVWKDDQAERPSYHWIMSRTIQHGIYHGGAISVLREEAGLGRADYRNWPAMADSLFLSGLITRAPITQGPHKGSR